MSKEHDNSRDARPRASISACIIARDEAARLPACLDSVAFCDEVVVVDSGSVDETAEIARDAGARVVLQPWLGFAGQRNVALDHASSEWALEIDADERVSPELQQEIEAFLEAPPAGVELGGLPLRDILLGRRLGPSGKYPKYRHRLLLRGAYRHDERRTVHEGILPRGPVHPFSGDLLHLFAETWSEALGDTWRYAQLELEQLTVSRSARAALIGVLVRPVSKFLYRLTLEGGWRDGPYGALRIGLDCASDSLVWLRHASGRREEDPDSPPASTITHYSTRARHEGSVRLIGIATGHAACARAAKWLSSAGAEGMDVALISDLSCESPSVRTRRVARAGPLQVLRALEAEQQLRSFDAVIAVGARAGMLLRLMPRRLRGIVGDVSERHSPAAAAAGVQARRHALAAERTDQRGVSEQRP